MKIILVFAGITKTGFNNYGLDDESSWIHHGLCSISASLKKNGYLTELIDLRRLKGWEDFRDKIRATRPDVAGLTMMSLDYNNVMRCVDIIKEVNPKTVTLAGGIHPSVAPGDVLRNPNIDYVIKGEGEVSFVNLLREIEAGRPPQERLIPGISLELEQLPPADRDLFEQDEMPITPDFPKPFVTLIVARGCAYNCNFCQPAERYAFGPRVRSRSVENVILELCELKKKFAFKSLMFHDDCLLQDIAWCRGFSREWVKLGSVVPFACQARADIICKKEDALSEMARAGLKLLLIGFESGSQRVLDFLNKGTTVKDNIEAARICRKHDIKIWANYMLGIPTETRAEVMATVRMLKKIQPDYYSAAYYTPHPGSKLYDYVKDRNLSLVSNYESFRRNPDQPKIKGVDYAFLRYANFVATTPLAGRLMRHPLRKIGRIYKNEGLSGLLRHIKKWVWM